MTITPLPPLNNVPFVRVDGLGLNSIEIPAVCADTPLKALTALLEANAAKTLQDASVEDFSFFEEPKAVAKWQEENGVIEL